MDTTSFKWYTIDTAREARPEGKGRRMYRERKSRTPAKTVTHFLKAVYEKWPGAVYQTHTEPNPTGSSPLYRS